jgi:mycothiol system anti-sigma-R factor
LSCQRSLEMMNPYLDGELDILQATEIKRHLERCDDCNIDYGSQLTLRSCLRDASLCYRAPLDLKVRIRSSLRREADAKMGQRNSLWTWRAIALSLAIMVLVVTVWKLAPLSRRPSREELLAQELVSDHIRSLQMTNHLADVMSSDQHTVKPWFDGKVDFSPSVKDFAAQDFRLYGGRLDYVNNRTVATLIYQRRLHYINLYIWPSEQQESIVEGTIERQGYNLMRWTSSNMTFWAISDLSRPELNDFAHLVQQAELK